MSHVVLPKLNQTGANEWADAEDNDRALRDVINGDLDNTNIAASAGIAHSKLATTTSGYLLVANASGVLTGVAMSGDATISNTGVLSLANNSVGNAEIADGAVDTAELAAGAVETAKIEDANVTDAKLASPNNSAYRTIAHSAQAVDGSGSTSTNYILRPGAGAPGSDFASTGTRSPYLFYLDDADYAVAGKTTKLRVRATVATGASAVLGLTINFGLHPISAVASSSFTVDAAVEGSTAAVEATGANTRYSSAGSDFTIPADGYYALGFSYSGATPSNVNLLSAVLQMRHV